LERAKGKKWRPANRKLNRQLRRVLGGKLLLIGIGKIFLLSTKSTVMRERQLLLAKAHYDIPRKKIGP